MNNQSIINLYRERLIKVHAVTVMLVSFVELFAYFVFVKLGLQPLSFACRYLWVNVLIPVVINAVAHFVARRICHTEKVQIRIKNKAIIYAAMVTTFVVSFFHRDYTVTMCAFVFPIILSALYNDKKILRETVGLAILSLTITVACLFFEKKLDLTTSLNVLVLYGFVAVSYLSGELSIRFSESNFAFIMEQAEANNKLTTILDLDPMTGVYNHRAFYERLEQALSETESHCLAVVDIDDFKKVNDNYGHNSGDVVLVRLANILKECCRENDSVCRIGGEEFAVIFKEKTVCEAREMISAALRRFSDARYDFTDEKITFSCGIARLLEEDGSKTAFERADGYLYTSKEQGKNRITVEPLSC